jgi:molybdenum cofactor cytidylyltransferase
MATPEVDGSRSTVSGVVLAAGASSRLGRPKQLLSVGDRRLLQCVLDSALASRLDEVIVVLGHLADEVRAAIPLETDSRVKVVVNPEYAAGQSTSLRRGLHAADPSACAAAILLGDQPTLTAELIDTVVAAFLASDAHAARPVYPDAGGAPGHPVVLGREIWSGLETLAGDRGARDLFAARPDWLLSLPVAGEPPLDVDSEDDYRRILGA